MTIDDIPEKLRQPGFIVYNGQEIHVTLTEKQCDALAFMADINQVCTLNEVYNRTK